MSLFVFHFLTFPRWGTCDDMTNVKLDFGQSREAVKKILTQKGITLHSESKDSILYKNSSRINGVYPFNFRCLFSTKDELAEIIYFFNTKSEQKQALKILESSYKVSLKKPKTKDRYLIQDFPALDPELFDYQLSVMDNDFSTSNMKGPTVFVLTAKDIARLEAEKAEKGK